MLNDPAGATQGINYLLPILMMAGGGQVGAGLALYFKTKNKKLKGYIRDSIPVGILGVGEPLMYAVTLPLGKSFITACLGAGVGGVLSRTVSFGNRIPGCIGAVRPADRKTGTADSIYYRYGCGLRRRFYSDLVLWCG